MMSSCFYRALRRKYLFRVKQPESILLMLDSCSRRKQLTRELFKMKQIVPYSTIIRIGADIRQMKNFHNAMSLAQILFYMIIQTKSTHLPLITIQINNR